MSTEQFLYEIAKKYGNDYDIEVQYERGDLEQIKRLSKYVRCKQWNKGEIVECDRYFANFNLDQAKYVKAKEYYFVVHANFNEIGYKPNISEIEHLNPKFIAVSEWARDKFIEFTGKPCECCYNPLTLEPKDEVINLVSACRLNDEVKGGKRTLQLIKALDKYCSLNNRHYVWTIFTNDIKFKIDSPNVVLRKGRIDVRPYIANAHYVLQLSNDMETYCYTTNEAWSYSVHTITTPLSVNKELPIPKEANYVLDWDCKNVDDVARHIFEDERKPFKYQAPKDNWVKYLEKGESTYLKERNTMVKVLVKKWHEGLIDNETKTPQCPNGRARQVGEIYETTLQRYNFLKEQQKVGLNIDVELVEEVQTATEPQKEVKKAVKKTTKTTKKK